METHPSFADDEEGVAACALADDVLSLFVGGLRGGVEKDVHNDILETRAPTFNDYLPPRGRRQS